MISTVKRHRRTSLSTGRFDGSRLGGHQAALEHLEPREMLAADFPTSEALEFSIRATDLSGNEIQQIASGQQFTIEVYANDRRGEAGVEVQTVVDQHGVTVVSDLPYGIFTAHLNITFAKDGFLFDSSRSIDAGPGIQHLHGELSPNVSVPGIISNVGLTDMASVNRVLAGILNPDPQLLFSIPMIAGNPGEYSGDRGIMPNFNFMRIVQSGGQYQYNQQGVPILANDPSFEYNTGTFTSLWKYGNASITDPNDVFFSGANLTVIPAGQVEGDFRIRVVKDPTPVNAQGEVVNLPTSANFIDEWDTVYVEIYGKADPGYGVQNAVVDIHFDANQFKFHDVIAKQQESSLKYSLAFADASTPGKVTVSLSNPLGNTGDDNFALLGRVRLMSIMELANDTSQGYIQPSSSLPISIGNVSPTLQVLGGDQSTIGTGTSAGFASFDVWPVMYDTDDSGRVGISDFANLISHYGQAVNSPETRRLDFNRDGKIGLGDFLLFIQNYGQQQGQVGTRTYMAGFPNSFLSGEPVMEGEPTMADSGLMEGEPVFTSTTVWPETSTESTTQSTGWTSFSESTQVVQYVDTDPIASEPLSQGELDSGVSDAFFETAEDPAMLDGGSDSDDLIYSVAVPPKADTTNEETDELFEEFDDLQNFDW